MSAYLSFIRGRRAWALIRGWALINFFCLWDGRLLEVGANSRLVAYSNNYGNIPYWVYTSSQGVFRRAYKRRGLYPRGILTGKELY